MLTPQVCCDLSKSNSSHWSLALRRQQRRGNAPPCSLGTSRLGHCHAEVSTPPIVLLRRLRRPLLQRPIVSNSESRVHHLPCHLESDLFVLDGPGRQRALSLSSPSVVCGVKALHQLCSICHAPVLIMDCWGVIHQWEHVTSHLHVVLAAAAMH